ncbi:MAG: DHA2 family efflux MFS transporter permease subunit [Clostridiaceae bacterium]|jgi:MFS transporter, DHA2 family, multidrug resistance protein|nr:DHA2 family efflux MFS transporter permease subunit [Clostridiaceae bacterium]
MSEEITTEKTIYPKNPWPSCSAILLAVFIYVMDTTIANVALPHMAGSFSATRDESMWILTSYLIASGIMIPSVDYFSKLFGRKNFYVISILLFTIASLLCGQAHTLGQMVMFRILQGAGGGGIVPISQALMLESFPPEKRGMSTSIFGLGVILAPIIGPVLGGWITDNWSWPWIFYINVPTGCLAAILATKFLYNPKYARRQKGVKLDGWGFLFLSLWLITLQIFFDKGNNADWFNAEWIRWVFGSSCFFCACFFTSQLFRKNTLVDLSVFKDWNFTVGTAIQVVMNSILYGSLAILPQFLQGMMGYTAFLSGYSMAPRGLGSMSATIVCAFLADRIDKRILIAIGLIFLGTSNLMFGSLNLQIANINIIIPNFIMGAGMGLCMVPIINLSVDFLKNNQMTNAAGLQNLLKNIGGAIGTSLVATMLSRFAQMHQFMLVGNLNNLNPQYASRLQYYTAAMSQYAHVTVANHMAQYYMYAQLVKQSTLWAFIDAFRIFSVAAFILIPLLLTLKTKKHEA